MRGGFEKLARGDSDNLLTMPTSHEVVRRDVTLVTKPMARRKEWANFIRHNAEVAHVAIRGDLRFEHSSLADLFMSRPREMNIHVAGQRADVDRFEAFVEKNSFHIWG